MRTRTAALTATAASLIGSVAGCSSPGQPDEPWSQVSSAFEGADFAHPDMPLDELILDADITVVGEFGEIVGERPLARDYVYVQIELIIREVIAGDVEVGDVLTFEGWTNEVTEVPQGEMLMFLAKKVSDVDPPGLWIWHTSRGIWTETERDEIDTPIAESPPAESPLYSDEVGDATSLADVVETMKLIARR